MPTLRDPLAGLTVLQRGWLSSNNILIHAAQGEAGAVLVDTSHVDHAAQTVALVGHALNGERLGRIVNTHLHSDHCGGNAALQRAFSVPVIVPPGQAEAVRAWDESSLSYAATGQRCERFGIAGTLLPDDAFNAGGRRWQVRAAPGHDTHALLFFDAEHGVLISADALWQRGFGVVFPEIDGEPGFDDVGATLDLIESLPVRVVIPGHGAPFTDVTAALAIARSRLASFKAEPARHARHAIKVLIKYHMLEQRRESLDALLRWAADTPMLARLWARHAPPTAATPAAWAGQVVAELVGQGALAMQGDVVLDR